MNIVGYSKQDKTCLKWVWHHLIMMEHKVRIGWDWPPWVLISLRFEIKQYLLLLLCDCFITEMNLFGHGLQCGIWIMDCSVADLMIGTESHTDLCLHNLTLIKLKAKIHIIIFHIWKCILDPLAHYIGLHHMLHNQPTFLLSLKISWPLSFNGI